jgi:hypothetical protein
MEAGDGLRPRRWNRDRSQGRHEAPSPRVAPFIYVREAATLICTPWPRRGRHPLSPEQRAAVLAVRERLAAEERDLPEVCWVDRERVIGIIRCEESWIASMAARYVVVTLVDA